MPYERDPRPGAARWTTILGLCLALVAAGSFIAFSLVARDATAPVDAPIVAVAPASSAAPVITFAQPGRGSAAIQPDGVRPSANGRDLVLGTRFFNGPITSGGSGSSGGSGDGCNHCGTKSPGVTDDDDAPVATPTRQPEEESYEGKSKHTPAGPSPQGQAKGHDKARGKGHHKHPND